MTKHITSIEYLKDRCDLIPTLCLWLEDEWSHWYGPAGPGDARKDLEANAEIESLPLGLIATYKNELAGYISLKCEAIYGYEAYGPWAGSALVHLNYRNQGVGTLLVGQLESEAKRLGFKEIYCGNKMRHGLLAKSNWLVIDQVFHNREQLFVFRKVL